MSATSREIRFSSRVPGLKAEFYVPGGAVTNFPNFNAAPKATRTDYAIYQMNGPWNFLDERMPLDHFGVRWTARSR